VLKASITYSSTGSQPDNLKDSLHINDINNMNKDNGMLTLTRKLGEKITIGDNVIVMITGIEGNRVKIGVDAPKAIPVHLVQKIDSLEQ